MDKPGNAQTRAVRMAQNDIETVIKSFKEEGHFMDKSVSAKTQAKHDRIDNASPEIRSLLDQGFTREFVERLARLEDK